MRWWDGKIGHLIFLSCLIVNIIFWSTLSHNHLPCHLSHHLPCHLSFNHLPSISLTLDNLLTSKLVDEMRWDGWWWDGKCWDGRWDGWFFHYHFYHLTYHHLPSQIEIILCLSHIWKEIFIKSHRTFKVWVYCIWLMLGDEMTW